MDELIKSLVLQMPAVAILLMATYRVYNDMRSDASTAVQQRQETTDAIKSLVAKMDTLIEMTSKRQ